MEAVKNSYTFRRGQRVSFTPEAHEKTTVAMAGVWMVESTRSAKPSNGALIVFHKQIVMLKGYPMGGLVSGGWLEPAGRRSR